MPGWHQKKYLSDGVTLNPAWTPDRRKRQGDRHKAGYIRPVRSKTLVDGAYNPKYQGKHQFVGIDGESVTLSTGEHRYVLLCASSSPDDYILNPDGLSTQDCFEFLLRLANTYPHAILVCFAMNYDVNMWLGDLGTADDTSPLRSLWHARNLGFEQQHIAWTAADGSRYSLSYLPRKSFHIAKYAAQPNTALDGQKTDKPRRVGKSAQIWDVFGFFQCAFTEALGGEKGYFKHLLQEQDREGELHHVLVWVTG